MIPEGFNAVLPDCHTPGTYFKRVLYATLKIKLTFENAVNSLLNAFFISNIFGLNRDLRMVCSSLLFPHFYGDKNDYYFVNSAKGETVSCFLVNVEPYL